MRTRCGRPTRTGRPCQIPLTGDRCPTHDSDLSARNAAVRRAFARNHPAEYAAHQLRAARAGFVATADQYGHSRATEKARQWRLGHPSEPERWAMDVLARAGLNHYEREYPVLDGNYSLDFAWPGQRRAIEIDGHPSRADDAEQTRRRERVARKQAELTAQGWQVLVVYATGDRAAASGQLLAFARAAQPDTNNDGQVWSS